MRLIDADALKQTIIQDYRRVFFGSVLWDILNDMPTIAAEPVRHGRWAHLGGDEWCCTKCGDVIHTEGSWEKPMKKYCHECGAKMDLED